MTKDRSNDTTRQGDASRSRPWGPEHAEVVKNVVGNFINPGTLVSKTSDGVCEHCNTPTGDSVHMNILGNHIVSDRI